MRINYYRIFLLMNQTSNRLEDYSLKKKNIIGSLLLFLSLLLIASLAWSRYSFYIKSFSQIVFLLQVPSAAGDHSMFLKWLILCALPSLIIFSVIVYVIFKSDLLFKNNTFMCKIFKKIKKYYLSISIIVLCGCLVISGFQYDFYHYLISRTETTTIYEDYYKDPRDVNIVFPHQKRNLIHIFLESIESSYVSKESGGISEKSFTPELEKLANENINFSNTDLIGGCQTIIGTQWTIASQVSQNSGIPLSLPIDGNSYTMTSEFLPGVYTIGEILEKNGYEQVFLSGSQASFGGTNNFYQHGHYKIKDYDYAIKNGWLPNDYYKFWGYEDSKLFEFAKNELTNLSKSNKPFNLEMITIDAHMPYGYLCDKCPKVSNDQYENVLACQSKQVYDFIEWCKQQDFYDNTTIVITGDHISMAQKFFTKFDSNYIRTPYNVFINSINQEGNSKNRQFSTMDFFPTILSSLGVEIEGERLGLGTNLFSDKPTLLEEMGWQFNEEVQKKSKFYNQKFIGIN